MPRHVSFDDLAEWLSPEEGPLPPSEDPPGAGLPPWRSSTLKWRCRSSAGYRPSTMRFAVLHFVEGLTQEGVSSIIGIGQPEVSGRSHWCIKLLPFLLKRPTGNPIELRNDLLELLPRRLVEPAHVFWTLTSPRAGRRICSATCQREHSEKPAEGGRDTPGGAGWPSRSVAHTTRPPSWISA